MRHLRLTALFLLVLVAPAWAISALDYTKTTLDQVHDIVASDKGHDDKLAALFALFDKFLDTDSMGKAALGAHWATFTPEQRKEFLKLFHNMMERTYVQRMLLFDNPNFNYAGETKLDGQARVDTKIITPRDEFSVSYLLRPADGRWLATKITVEDVSLTANLASQLDRLLSHNSVDDVLSIMRKKYGDTGSTDQP
jgi:phospholipid transport system substrate-binding protein